MSFRVLKRGNVTIPRGFKASGVACGIKKDGKLDLAIIYSQKDATCAAVFTTNRIQAAPVLVCKEKLKESKLFRAVVVNSGNANACTGDKGIQDAKRMTEIVGRELGLDPREVLVASTGVIGVSLPMDNIERGISEAVNCLSERPNRRAARAISTTDKRLKDIALSVDTPQGEFRIGGIAKGSGMISPNLATMLSFITTDARVPSKLLRRCLVKSVNQSFNNITVDGDMSTNDTVMVFANGASSVTFGADNISPFQEALDFVTLTLAHKIVEDGEGATKFIEISIRGADKKKKARRVALAIANSNLFKTAMFGMDANWGRILAAIGASGVNISVDNIDVTFRSNRGSIVVAKSSRGVPFSEEKALEVLRERRINVDVNLNAGNRECTVWTTDLTYKYVRINAAYRS
ncbi:MAG: bifunctional glutamate N-acetyltransferase/amino-acid acetyltransferase ArgJ [bacterium]